MVKSPECVEVFGCIFLPAFSYVWPFACVWESTFVWKRHQPRASWCLPLINPLITVISDSFHHYRFHTTHCLPPHTTIPGENFTRTQEHTEAWLLITHSSTFTPAVCHPSLCHWGERWRKERGRREKKLRRGERKRTVQRQRKEWPRLSFYLELGLS